MSRPPMSKVHLTLAIVWGMLIVPTLLWWRESVFWVAIMSLYANLVGHWSAYQASRAEEKQESTSPISTPDPSVDVPELPELPPPDYYSAVGTSDSYDDPPHYPIPRPPARILPISPRIHDPGDT